MAELATWAMANPDLEFLGEGVHRKAFLMPNGKVFKMETGEESSDPDEHNTDLQIYVYNSEKVHFFPKIFAYGNNWVVEERVDAVDEALGLNRYAWAEAARVLSKCDSGAEIKALAEENYFVGKLWESPRVRSMIEMFFRNGLDLAELRLDNLGLRKNGQLVVLDYSTTV